MSYFQDLLPGNHCFGCGPNNSQGLQIKSRWLGDRQAECLFEPQAHHCSGPLEYVNGGIIGTLFDCHCICTAIAQAYRMQGRDIGQGELLWYVTGSLQVSYLKPTPISETLRVVAQIDEIKERTMDVLAQAWVKDTQVATAKVLAVRVGADW